MKAKCKVCGCEFNLINKRHYISRDAIKNGVAAFASGCYEESIYDTFDCPRCGCQMIIQQRKRRYVESDDEDE